MNAYQKRLAAYRQVLKKFGGKLYGGRHETAVRVCALELASQLRGTVLTDNPQYLGLPDVRLLNDAAWDSDALRTRHMLPILAAYHEWYIWSDTRRRQAVEQIAFDLIKQALPLAVPFMGIEPRADHYNNVVTPQQAMAMEWASGNQDWQDLATFIGREDATRDEADNAMRSAARVVYQLSWLLEGTTKERQRFLAAACRVWRDAGRAQEIKPC